MVYFHGGDGKTFLTPSLRKAIFVRQRKRILHQILFPVLSPLYGGGTDTQTYESTLHAASDDHGIEAGGYFNKCSWNHLAMFISASLSASTLLIGWLLSGYESNLALVP